MKKKQDSFVGARREQENGLLGERERSAPVAKAMRRRAEIDDAVRGKERSQVFEGRVTSDWEM